MSDGSAFLLNIATTGVSCFATWYCSRWFYLRSGPDLDAALRPIAGDNQKLLQATNAIARMLEQAGIGHPTYDAAGNLTGVLIRPSASEGAVASEGAIVTHTWVGVPEYDRQHEQPPAPEPEDDNA
jgi:hypothetical protein